jgi:hypothetical protein
MGVKVGQSRGRLLMRLRLAWVTVVASGALTAGLAGGAGASARNCSASPTRSPNPGAFGDTLQAVAAPSACSAWAVGTYVNHGAERSLIEHWNGKSWKLQSSPTPHNSDTDYSLYGVAALADGDAWAVGQYGNAHIGFRTLIERWDGKSWNFQPSPNLGGKRGYDDTLFSVAAASSTNAWAVGSYLDRRGHVVTLIEHWNGKSWRAQPSPSRGVGDELQSVAALSSHDAWAVGYYLTNGGQRTLIEQWNGKAWKVQPSPDPVSGNDELYGVTAASSSAVWAVGFYSTGGPRRKRALIERWSGKSWKVEPSPGRGGADSHGQLAAVASVSSKSAWAVGYFQTNTGGEDTLIEHYNGHHWQVDPSPNPSADYNQLLGVAAVSSKDVWGVGQYFTGGGYRTLIGHSNGSAWTG